MGTTIKKPFSQHQQHEENNNIAFPIAPAKTEFSENYVKWFSELKQHITQQRLKIVLSSNIAMILLYWDIGQRIIEKQNNEGWGSKVIDRLSIDLIENFPEMKGFSSRNLKYMRAFAQAWPNREIVQASLAQLSWYHNVALLEKLKTPEERLWYAAKAYENGWSRNILAMQIETQAYLRFGKAQNNFLATLPATDSDMAIQIFKDPYLFDFLGTDIPRREAELEQGLIEHIQKFLIELGRGFAFVGRQKHLELGGQDFYLDLLFYHLELRCYIVIEIKAREFEPGDSAQLGMYMHAVDKLLRHKDDKSTIGLLLVRDKNKILVEYALESINQPISIAEWKATLTQSLPENLKSSLPTIEEIEDDLLEKDLEKVTELCRLSLEGKITLQELEKKRIGALINNITYLKIKKHIEDDKELNAEYIRLIKQYDQFTDDNDNPGTHVWELAGARLLDRLGMILEAHPDKKGENQNTANKPAYPDLSFKKKNENKSRYLECGTRTRSYAKNYIILLKHFYRFFEFAKNIKSLQPDLIWKDFWIGPGMFNVLHSLYGENKDFVDKFYDFIRSDDAIIAGIKLQDKAEYQSNKMQYLVDVLQKWRRIHFYIKTFYPYLLLGDMEKQLQEIELPNWIYGQDKRLDDYTDLLAQTITDKLDKDYFGENKQNPVLAISLALNNDLICPNTEINSLDILSSKKLMEQYPIFMEKLRYLPAVIICANWYNWFPEYSKNNHGATLGEENHVYKIWYNSRYYKLEELQEIREIFESIPQQ